MALHEFIFGSNNNIEQDIEELLINFYKQLYLYFKKIGIGLGMKNIFMLSHLL